MTWRLVQDNNVGIKWECTSCALFTVCLFEAETGEWVVETMPENPDSETKLIRQERRYAEDMAYRLMSRHDGNTSAQRVPKRERRATTP